MSHVDDHILELYVLGAAEVAARRGEIQAHLNGCPGCAALHREMTEYYREVERISAEHERKTAEALVVRGMVQEAPAGIAGTGFHQTHLPMKARVVLFVLRYPVLSSTSAVALFVAALMMVNFFQTRRDTNPAYARADNEFLVLYNRDGGELWRLHVGQYFDNEGLGRAGYGTENTVAVVDVDGDGRNEVIGTFGVIGEWRNMDAVTCFASDGAVRWEYQVHRRMVFGTEAFTDAYRVDSFTAGDLDGDGTVEVIAVGHCEMYYPTVVVKLDAATGALREEYWHSGNLGAPAAHDLNGDGVKEILLAGQNNGYNCAVFMVLDPRTMSGSGPAPPAYTARDVPGGNQLAYIFFPVSGLGGLTDKRARVNHFWHQGNEIVARVSETFQGTPYSLLFHFDESLRCTHVVASDEYVTLYHRLLAQGRVSEPLDSTYLDRLRTGLRYWDGGQPVPWSAALVAP